MPLVQKAIKSSKLLLEMKDLLLITITIYCLLALSKDIITLFDLLLSWTLLSGRRFLLMIF